MVWPDGSWAVSRLVGDDSTRGRATVALVLAAVGFVVGGVGILAGQDWGRSLVAGTAVFSALLYALMWNGKRQDLAGQGAVGFVIDVALLIVAVGLQWPQ